MAEAWDELDLDTQEYGTGFWKGIQEQVLGGDAVVITSSTSDRFVQGYADAVEDVRAARANEGEPPEHNDPWRTQIRRDCRQATAMTLALAQGLGLRP